MPKMPILIIKIQGSPGTASGVINDRISSPSVNLIDKPWIA